MPYQLIQDLCESAVFRTRQATSKYGPQESVDFFYAYLLATVALSMDPRTEKWARNYLSRTAAFNNFDHFRVSGTDLYVLAFMVNQNRSSGLMGQRLVTTLRAIARGSMEDVGAQTFLLRLEREIGVRNTRLKTIRRLLTTWKTLPESTRANNLAILRREILSYSPRSEILKQLDRASRKGKGRSFAKTAGIIGAAGLAGLYLGTRYDPNKYFNPLKVKLGESMEDQSHPFVDELKKNPLVESVTDVRQDGDSIKAVVRCKDGSSYGIALAQLEEPPQNS